MGFKGPLTVVAEVTTLLFVVSYAVLSAEAALATTCYVELGSDLFIDELDFACGVVNDTSVGVCQRRNSTGSDRLNSYP